MYIEIIRNEAKGVWGLNGELKGIVSGDGRSITARWSRTKLHDPNSLSGMAWFTLSEDGNSFTGIWDRTHPANLIDSTKKSWEGKRVDCSQMKEVETLKNRIKQIR